MCFLDILVVLRLDLGQISFNPVETQQLAFLATIIVFYHIVTREDEKVTYVFRLFNFWKFFFRVSFLSFFLFAAVIDLLLGLLALKKLLRKRHRDGRFLAWSNQV